MKLIRRTLLLGLLTLVGAAWSQSYPDPSRPLRIITPTGAGDAIDLLARTLGRAITDETGWKVFVENRPGAESVIGMMAAKTAAPDGYTMLLATSSSMVLSPHMLDKLPFDPAADYIPVSGLAKSALTTSISASLPFKSVREFVEAAKANPGKYTVGASTPTTRLAGEMLKQRAGVNLLVVPYKTSGDAVSAVASGQVDMFMVDVPTASPFWQSGRTRFVGVTGTSRMSKFPEMPTLAEQGVAGYSLTGWYATYLPAHTPPAVVTALREIVRKARSNPAVTKVIADASMEPLEAMGDDLRTMQRADSESWGKVLRAANIKAQ